MTGRMARRRTDVSSCGVLRICQQRLSVALVWARVVQQGGLFASCVVLWLGLVPQGRPCLIQ